MNRPSPQAKKDQTPGDRAQADKFPAAEPAACLRWMMPPSSVATPPGRGVCGGDRGVAGCWVRTCRCALLRAHLWRPEEDVRVLLHHSALFPETGSLAGAGAKLAGSKVHPSSCLCCAWCSSCSLCIHMPSSPPGVET